MTIQWFPGHMTSARKKAAETMALTDVVIEVCDARLPEASSNPMIRELRQHRQRPCLKLLNKADLADPAATQAWLDYYNSQPGVKAVAISSKKPGEAARVPGLCKSLAPHRNDGVKPLRMLGPTMSITDTPGLMWPKITHDSDGFMLAASHAIGRNAVIESEVAIFLATLLLQRYPAALAERYGFATAGMDGVGVVEAVAKKRGCIAKGRRGGELDLEKAAMILLTDYRAGKLGRVSLETPQSRAAMLAAAASETGAPGIPAAANPD